MSLNSIADQLRSELSVARNEIKNLRKQINALSHVHTKDVQYICDTLQQFRVDVDHPITPPPQPGSTATRTATSRPGSKISPSPSTANNAAGGDASTTDAAGSSPSSSSVTFQPIGTIRTAFADKRAVPRQPTVGAKLLGCVELNDAAFTNPEHAVAGLQDFSHMWIVYHFHRNEASTRAKVAPPRLNGERVGVFSTRSPHRPCPIGLSLVEIHKVDGSRIYFFGTDMVNGTPVLDVKPYIPLYDNPSALDGGDGDEEAAIGGGQPVAARTPLRKPQQMSSREEPDGEESEQECGAGGASGQGGGGGGQAAGVSMSMTDEMAAELEPKGVTKTVVRVPDWIMAAPTLQVEFNERAEDELVELDVNRSSIVDVLSADPRSVYIRTKYGSQIFTFQLGAVAVTCKFDDLAANVTVVRIRRTENLSAEKQED